MQNLIHHTCLGVAMQIINSRVFKYSDSAGDRGMNLLTMDGLSTSGNDCTHSGVHMEFKWHGNAAIKPSGQAQNLNAPNTLYDQLPWRMFLSPNLSPNLMQASSITLNDQNGFCKYCGNHRHINWIDKFIPSMRSESIKKLVQKTNTRLSHEKIFIERMDKIIDFIP